MLSIFQEFGVRDLINAVAIAEDGFFVTGTGTGQPQGLVGNTGTGTGSTVSCRSPPALICSTPRTIFWARSREATSPMRRG